MGLSKLVAEKTGQKTNPRAIAQQIVQNLQLGDMGTTEIAGPVAMEPEPVTTAAPRVPRTNIKP